MKKLFIIGTGRNGSKLTGKILGTAINKKNRFGEIHHGLKPIFFRDVYLEKISKSNAIRKFKISRDKAIENLSGEIYTEKNHLVVPILECVCEAYPDALFLYVYRYPKDIIRSLYSRNVYTGDKNVYEEGRLEPNKSDKYYKLWANMNKFEKVCWYVSTMMFMCDNFLKNLDNDSYRIISYNDFVKDHSLFVPIFDWLSLDFDIKKIDKILSVQIGSSARSKSELNFKVNNSKIKNTPHWNKWSDKQNEIYRRFFDE